MHHKAMSAGSAPAFRHQATGLQAFDEACLGLPVGALTQVTGRHAEDVDLLVDALRRADPTIAIMDVAYDVVTKKYRSVVEELRRLHAQEYPVIVRCSPPDEFSRDYDGEEALVRAVGTVAKIYPRPIVLAWRGRLGEDVDDVDGLELWMENTNVVTLLDARRDDEEDDVLGVAHEQMVGDLLFEVAFFDPRSKDVQFRTLNANNAR